MLGGREGGGDLKERERGNDRLIYSKSEEWVNQTLMAFGSASRSHSPFNLSPSHSIFPSARPPNTPTTLQSLPLSPPQMHFWMVTHKPRPALLLTDESPLILAWHANQGALHAQRDKVNDRKIKRGTGDDLPSRLAACVMPSQCLLR